MQEDTLLKDKVLIHSRASRFFHWTFAVNVILLTLAGFYDHRPPDLGPFFHWANTYILHITGYVSMGIFTAWVYYLIVTGSFRHLLFRFKDIRELPAFLKYIFFWEQNLPPHAKYNVGQKLIYTGWFYAFIFETVTGLFLEFPDWINYAPPLTLQLMRYYHYMVGLYFIVTIPLHIYLAVTEDPARFQAMLTGWVKKPQKDPFEVKRDVK